MAENDRPDAEEKDPLVEAVDQAEPVVAEEPDRSMVDDPLEATVTIEESGASPTDTVADSVPPIQPPSPTPAPAVQNQGGQGGFVGVVVGGIIAAAIGYGVAVYAPLGGASDLKGQMTALKAENASLSERIAAVEATPAPATLDPALEARVVALETAPAPAPAEPVDLVPLQGLIADIDDRLTALDGRLTAIENRPPSEGGAATSPAMEATVEALRQEVESLKGAGDAATANIEAMAAEAQARLTEAEQRAAQMRAEAEQTAQKAMARAGLGRIQAALESGAPFESALADLGGIEVPAILRDAAAEGITSRADLVEAFPAAARAALEASLRANTGDTWSERLGSFLQSTTGARSLTPREGNDPDAILSRAEAALRADDLDAAMTEIGALPPEGQAAMADWVALATARQDAAKAVADLSSAIDG